MDDVLTAADLKCMLADAVGLGAEASVYEMLVKVRALRKDRERLDWLERNIYVAQDIVPGGDVAELDWRQAIDAALSARGGEDGA